MKSNGYVFLQDREDSESDFFIATEEFWEKNHHFDDQLKVGDIKFPKGFSESMESAVGYYGKGDPIKLLKEAGFRQVFE
jgi:hypothetical protein